MKKLLLTLAVFFAANLFASDIEVGGIWYDFNDIEGTASVTFKGETSSSFNEYSGDVVIPETISYNSTTYTVTEIGRQAFLGCDEMTSIKIPNTVTTICSWAFSHCKKLTALHIPASVTQIQGAPNDYCMKTITVDEGNTVYDSRDNCNAIIETATNTLAIGCCGTVIPNTVTSLGWCAFQSCSNLQKIVIPESVGYIDNGCFNDCHNLTEIICHATTPPTCYPSDVFKYVPTNIPVYVPAGSVDAYKAADIWKDFTNIQEIQPLKITVAGVSVTNDNCNDVLGDGTVKFNQATNTLILTNANIEIDYNGIKIEENDITIQLNGINNISSHSYAGIFFSKCTGGKITGPGTANIKSTTVGVYMTHGSLLIENCYLNVRGDNYAIAGNGNLSEDLTIDNAYINMSATKEYTCGGLHSLTLKNCKFSTSGISFNTTLHGVSTDGGKTVTKNPLTISPTTGVYPVVIMNMQLYSFNAADPLGDGTVSYDPSTKTLALNNANLSYDNYDVVALWDDITIQLTGINTIVSGGYSAIYSDDYTTHIIGDKNAVLDLKSAHSNGFYGGELHISGGCTMDVTGGVFGVSLSNADLYIDGSTLTATSTGTDDYLSAIGGLKSEPKLTDAKVMTEGVTFDATQKTYVDGDGNKAKTITIQGNSSEDLRVELIVYTIGEGTVNGEKTYKVKVQSGTKVTLNAAASKTNYQFAHWNNRTYGADDETSITVEVTKNLSLAAIFIDEEDAYKLTARAEDDEEEYGTVEVSLCVDEENNIYVPAMNGMYPTETVLRVKAIANEGYEFVCWNKEEEEPNTNETRKITLNRNRTLYAHFQKATGLNDIQTEAVTARKFIRNGQLYIVRDSIVYDARGAKVE